MLLYLSNCLPINPYIHTSLSFSLSLSLFGKENGRITIEYLSCVDQTYWDHPVSQVSVLGHLHGSQHRQVDVTSEDVKTKTSVSESITPTLGVGDMEEVNIIIIIRSLFLMLMQVMVSAFVWKITC